MFQNTRHTEPPTWMPVTQDDLRNLQVGGTVTPAPTTGVFPISIINLPSAAPGELLLRLLLEDIVFTGGTVDSGVAATGTPSLEIRKNGVANGSITSAGVVTFTDPDYTSDVFELYAPATPDATWDEVAVTLETT